MLHLISKYLGIVIIIAMHKQTQKFIIKLFNAPYSQLI